MVLNAVKWQILHGSIARRLVFRTLLVASTMSIIPLLHILSDTDFGVLAPAISGDCVANLGLAKAKLTGSPYSFKGHFLNPFWEALESVKCEENVNLTVDVAKELLKMKLLNYSAKALCVGEGSVSAAWVLRDLGFSDAVAVNGRRFFSLRQKQFVYELNYKDHSLDFVFSKDVDRLSVPALLVLEIERVLRPGGIGAIIVSPGSSAPNSLIRTATPVSSLLKTSSIMHVGYINNFTLVVFRKKFDNFGYFEQYRLPADCPSLTMNRPFINQMEPLVKEKPMESEKIFTFLPKFIDVSPRKRLVYIDIGAGKQLNQNASNKFKFLPFYPVNSKAFNSYFVDHNTSVLLSYVKKPGVTFVYHPGLAGTRSKPMEGHDDDIIDPSVEDEGFDFLAWFKETVKYADFVLLKMNAREVELKFLSELFESGVICSVDEMFLGCSDDGEAESAMKGDCMDLLKGLRNSGVFVHQWWDDDTPIVW